MCIKQQLTELKKINAITSGNYIYKVQCIDDCLQADLSVNSWWCDVMYSFQHPTL